MSKKAVKRNKPPKQSIAPKGNNIGIEDLSLEAKLNAVIPQVEGNIRVAKLELEEAKQKLAKLEGNLAAYITVRNTLSEEAVERNESTEQDDTGNGAHTDA